MKHHDWQLSSAHDWARRVCGYVLDTAAPIPVRRCTESGIASSNWEHSSPRYFGFTFAQGENAAMTRPPVFMSLIHSWKCYSSYPCKVAWTWYGIIDEWCWCFVVFPGPANTDPHYERVFLLDPQYQNPAVLRNKLPELSQSAEASGKQFQTISIYTNSESLYRHVSSKKSKNCISDALKCSRFCDDVFGHDWLELLLELGPGLC